MENNENKKFYELDENERKEKYKQSFKKAKPILKRVLFILILIAFCLILVLSVLRDPGKASDKTSEVIKLILR